MKFSVQPVRAFFCLLLFIALAAQAVMAGIMPAQSQSGKIQIEICSGMGLATITIDDASGAPAHGQKDKVSHGCPYAPVMAGAVPLDMPQMIVPLLVTITHSSVLAAQLAEISQKYWTSQGPPHFLMHA